MGEDMWRLWFTKLLLMLAAVLLFAAVETRSEGEFSCFGVLFALLLFENEGLRRWSDTLWYQWQDLQFEETVGRVFESTNLFLQTLEYFSARSHEALEIHNRILSNSWNFSFKFLFFILLILNANVVRRFQFKIAIPFQGTVKACSVFYEIYHRSNIWTVIFKLSYKISIPLKTERIHEVAWLSNCRIEVLWNEKRLVALACLAEFSRVSLRLCKRRHLHRASQSWLETR